jgi:hypothetical protein
LCFSFSCYDFFLKCWLRCGLQQDNIPLSFKPINKNQPQPPNKTKNQNPLGYSKEVTTPLGGWGLDGLLASRQSVLNGIVNGIDIDEWDPSTDRHLPVNYGPRDVAEGKAACKVALQRELGLPVGPDIPLLVRPCCCLLVWFASLVNRRGLCFLTRSPADVLSNHSRTSFNAKPNTQNNQTEKAFIGRADAQKGVDLILAAAPALLARGVQLVCLGSGDAHLEVSKKNDCFCFALCATRLRLCDCFFCMCACTSACCCFQHHFINKPLLLHTKNQ